MPRRQSKHPLASLVAVSLLLGVVPACTASGFRRSRPQVAEPDGSGNIVYRPVFPGRPARREVYLGGYAGTVYPPLRTGPGWLNPTGFRDPNTPRHGLWGWWRH